MDVKATHGFVNSLELCLLPGQWRSLSEVFLKVSLNVPPLCVFLANDAQNGAREDVHGRHMFHMNTMNDFTAMHLNL